MLITITVMLGMIMAIIDTTIINVALNNIAGNLGASVDEVSWVATGYILASVCVMPLNGWLTAFLGRKRFYAASLAIFTISSFLCGTATSITQLIIYRVIQGIGGGALQPTAQALLFETYPPEKRGSAMAIFGLGAMVGPAVGPTLGGYIVDNANWPLIFFINIPIGVIAFMMTMAFIPNPKFIERVKSSIDWIGLSLLVSGLASLQYVLERGEHDEWYSSSTIWILTMVAAIGLSVFVFRALRQRFPLVQLRVFRIPSFAVGNVIGVVTGFGLFGSALILPLFYQTVLGFTAFDTGLALLPGALSTAVSMFIIGRISNRVDPRISIAFGMLVFAYSSWMLGALTSDAGYWNVFWPRLVQGFGLGFLFVPLTTVALGDVPIPELAGATGVNTLVRQIGGSFGIAILTTLLTHETAIAWNVLSSGVTRAQGYPVAVLTQMVAQQSAVISYDFLFRLTAIVFLVATPLVFFIRLKPRTGAVPAMAMAAE
ncbi:MAG: DHA2 family efflux MFS transporter permease subunit [Candidatus Eremiobacteraeota bacterium]|nr:DHA2 family efflux MFS transporter permease subunit [Candidatus Eremiobacteraeota bacterium]